MELAFGGGGGAPFTPRLMSMPISRGCGPFRMWAPTLLPPQAGQCVRPPHQGGKGGGVFHNGREGTTCSAP